MNRARTLTLAAAVLGPVAVGALLGLVRGAVTAGNAALVLVLVVVAVAAAGRRVAGVVAAVVSTVAFDFFLTRPYFDLAVTGRDDVETAVLLGLIGLAVTEIALWGRRQQARASARAGYLDGVVSTARLAASGAVPPSDVVALVARQIGDVLALDDCRFETGPDRADRPRLEADGTIRHRDRPVDVEREGLPTMDAIALPVRSAGTEHGRFLLVSAGAVRRPDLERRLVAVTLADQAAAALAAGPADRAELSACPDARSSS